MQGKARQDWDFLIIGLSIYQAVTIPLAICLDPDIFNAPMVRTFDNIVNLIFLADIILQFRTTYVHPVTGEEIIDPTLITTRYL